MIEMVYKGEKSDAGQIVLPKNVRQVGEAAPDRKIYIEDYVVTYMRQKITENKNLGCILVLTGRREYTQDALYLFVSGALSVDYGKVKEGYLFGDAVWGQVYDTVKKYFVSSEIVGWLIYDDELTEDKLLQAQKKNFPAEDTLLITQEAYEEESTYYLFRGGMLDKLTGFFVYYEKNEAMQEFMVNHYRGAEVPVEEELRRREAPIQSFRSKMRDRHGGEWRREQQERAREKAREKAGHGRMLSGIYASCAALVLLLLLAGINRMSHYGERQEMQGTLAQAEEAGAAAGEETAGTGSADQADTPGQADTTSQAATAGQADTAGQAGTAGQTDTAGQDGTAEPAQASEQAAVVQVVPSGVEAQEGSAQGGAEVTQENPAAQEEAGQETGTAGSAGQVSQAAGLPAEQVEQQADALEQQAASPSDVPEQQAAPDTQPEQGQESQQETVETAGQAGVYYTVKPGDTLMKISREIYGSASMVDEICAANGIANGDFIEAGQQLRLP